MSAMPEEMTIIAKYLHFEGINEYDNLSLWIKGQSAYLSINQRHVLISFIQKILSDGTSPEDMNRIWKTAGADMIFVNVNEVPGFFREVLHALKDVETVSVVRKQSDL